MKKILITGKNSFIGNSLTQYLSQSHYDLSTISLRNPSWQNENFSGFDSIIHVAGIAHDSTKNADKNLYYEINSQLTFDTAKKAKLEGVKQFIFMSSSIIYGKSAPIGQNKIITINSQPNPESYYGDSKLKAEQLLSSLNDENFRICILRCPMIYGRNSKGNYQLLSRIAKTLPIFPKINNCRSMLYIENLCEFIRLMIDNNEAGIFWPQNNQYSNTSELVKLIAQAHNKKIILVPFCEFPLKIISHFTGLINKAFGSLVYDMALSEYKINYRLYNLRESIIKTETY